MKRTLLLGAVALFLAWTALTAMTQVQPGERALVRRLGRILDYKPGPGLCLGLPWGMDRVDRVPIGRERRVLIGQVDGKNADLEEISIPAGQLLTGDHNLVNVQAEVYYTVIEDQVDRFVLHADRAEAVVARLAEAALAVWVAGRTVDEVLTFGPKLLPAFLVQDVQTALPEGLGIQIERVNINWVLPPMDVKDAFDRLAQAQANVGTQINKAKQDAVAKMDQAEGQRFHMQRLAANYANEQRLQAQADADNFLRRLVPYRKLVARDPNYLNALWQDEMTRLYARMRATRRIDVLDHYLAGEGLNLTQFPLLPRKK